MTDLPARRLTCREIVGLLTDYLDDALDAPERARVEAHLHSCAGCTAYLEQVRATIGTLGRLREEDIPRTIRDRLADSFRGWRGLA